MKALQVTRNGPPGEVLEVVDAGAGVCARLGMGRLGVVALDGMKIAANASKSANRTEETLRKMAAETVAWHAAEDDLFGAGARGDEVPEDAWRPGRRDERIAAALASLRAERAAAEQAEADKAEAWRARQRTEKAAGRPPAASAVALAEEGLARARADRAAQLAGLDKRRAAGQRQRGRAAGIDDYCRVRQAAARVEAARAADAGRTAAEKEQNRF